ncbi:MAG: Gfo/Idh/MocA family protein [Candidatus Brocadiia bacterium]
MKPITCGVIGTGGWGEIHARVYERAPRARLLALCDTDGDHLQQVGRKYGVSRLYTDCGEMFRAEELDAVSIVTPDFAHTELALEAIQNGVHVLIEKPLATTLEDCDRIGRALKRNPVKFMVDFHNRWNPSMVEFKRSIEDGNVGEVQMVHYRLSDNISVPTEMLSWAGRSSVLWFLGSHCLDTLRWLLGEEVEEVYSVVGSGVLHNVGIETPDYYQSTLTFSGGTTVQMENCWILPPSHPLIDVKLEVVGSEGALYFDGRPHRTERFEQTEVSWPDVYVCPQVFGRPAGFAPESIRHFIECIVEDRQPICGWEAGREVTRCILAMEQSARDQSPVQL